jgi:N-acetylglucosaminyl-diphospho-decaprenol L-rhamnosyltransferase
MRDIAATPDPSPASERRRVAAIVVHYGDPALTWRAVQSLAADPRDAALLAEIVVVDNDPAHRLGAPPADFPPALLAEGGRVALEVLVSERNRGFGGGANLAFATLDPAREPWLFVLNNDATLEPGSLADLVAEAEKRRAEGGGEAIFAPLILDDRGPPELALVWAAGGALQIEKARAFNRHMGRPLSEIAYHIGFETLRFASGCAFLAETRTIQAEGGFDEAFFLYYEDADFCLRLAEANGGASACWFVPTAMVRHEVSRGLGFAPAQERHNWRHRGWLLRRHAPSRAILLRGIAYLVAAAAARSFGRLLRCEPRQAWAIACGTCGGLLRPLPKRPAR